MTRLKEPAVACKPSPTSDRRTSAESSNASPASLVELTEAVLRCTSVDAAYRTLTAGLARCFPCEFAAVASRRGGEFAIRRFSHLDSFDSSSATVRDWQDACSEYYSAFGDAASIQSLDVRTGESVVFLPLFSIAGEIVAFALLKPRADGAARLDADSLQPFADHLGPVLEIKLQALARGAVGGRYTAFRKWLARHRRAAWCVAAAAGLLALFPYPDRIRCAAELQPVVRRHVVAPFDGVLSECIAKPGDVVAAGQILGRLDPKELTWEIAAAAADRDRAAKSRDVNMAAGKTAAAQIDRLEIKRLEERLKLLESRLENLDVAAPVAGVVVSGNLERMAGAPVEIGQSLFEIAPLDRMVIEVLVPETEIDRVAENQPATLYLNSSPGAAVEGTVARVFPRAEIRDNANVFVAEVPVAGDGERLRPGMKGVVYIAAGRRPLSVVWGRQIADALLRLVQ